MNASDIVLHRHDIPLNQTTPATAVQSLLVVRSWWRVLYRSKVMAVQAYATHVALIATALVLVGHWIWARLSHDPTNFARGGASVSFITALLLSLLATYTFDRGFVLDGGKVAKFDPLKPSFVVPMLALVGTLVWGYGDLLPGFGAAKPDAGAVPAIKATGDAPVTAPKPVAP